MRSKEEHRQLIFFLSGFLIGVLYIYFVGDEGAGGTDFLSLQNLMQVKYMDIAYEEYFWYLLKKRLGILFLLFAVALALPGKILLFGFLMVFGCSMGSMLSVLVMRYGFEGVLLFLGLVLPQDIVYVPVFFSWVYLLAGWNEGLFPRGGFRNRAGHSIRHGFIQFFCLTGVTIIGILLECYVNPKVLNFFLKIF
ncbi:MAG: stage II sporulation protein M [Lachnospiraceae bacterium]|nr:stage II sporulation protein M [Lachnospiraceae bacterium]